MADSDQKQDSPAKAVSPSGEGGASKKYTREEMLADSRGVAGVSRHVMIGALHGIDQEKLTKSQAKSAVKDFLEREAA